MAEAENRTSNRERHPQPVAPPLELTTVWQCASVEQAERLLAGEMPGDVYRRDGHPGARRLTELWCRRHAARWAMATSSGMAALATLLLARLRSGDHVLLAEELYGRTQRLFQDEGSRWGITVDRVDPCSLESLEQAWRPESRLLLVETISNPRLRVVDVEQVARWCHDRGVLLAVDHTLATSTSFQPLESGADYVVESLTKFANGHSDAVLGVVGGRDDSGARFDDVVRTWGMVASPLDCWLTERGWLTLDVRSERACRTAAEIAEMLKRHPSVTDVRYPGLPDHPDHEVARRQFGARFGSMVTFTLRGGRAMVDRLAESIPFCPSLGEARTTFSHPRSTSHRSYTPEQCQSLGIEEGTVRLSVGCEPSREVIELVTVALDRLD